ncbi:MAG: DUF1573 domain-containing protein [Flavobacteriaceae bacterium]|nr:DUF1573 domain-containing protein [Flavobacteriaceae bacterium]PHX77647.1 MAG: hypothetical protein CK543_02000 [Flavobacteriales bacterium]
MNTKFFRIFIPTLLFCTQIGAQNPTITPKGPEIQFDHIKHDFGKIEESIHYAIHRFPFHNTGTTPLHIQQVHTSCGCTTPDWTRDSIPPGGKGFIEARFETNNRIGSFQKSITVYSDAVTASLVHLDIEGEVLKPRIDPNAALMPDMGKMSFSAPSFSFLELSDNQQDSQTIRITNETPYTANFEPINPSQIPTFIKILSYPTTLEPNEIAYFKIKIDGTKISHYGFGAIELPYTTDNPAALFNSIYVNYVRRQYFPKMNAKQLAKQPKLEIDVTEINWGKKVAGDLLFTDIHVKNTGKTELKIHDITQDCGCITLKFDKKILAPGESMPIRVFFDTVLKKGNANYNIWIVCNDPVAPERNVPIKAVFDAKVIECQNCPK